MHFTPLLADAILPGLVQVWPLFILLLIPIVAVEALYSRRRLKMQRWACIRVLGVANILSALAGLPLGHLLAAGVQYAAEGAYFSSAYTLPKNATWMGDTPLTIQAKKHDDFYLMFLGIYPRWILLLSAAVMSGLCFLISWWVETKWVKRYLAKTGRNDEAAAGSVSQTIRNANLLSYAIVVWSVIWWFNTIWPS